MMAEIASGDDDYRRGEENTEQQLTEDVHVTTRKDAGVIVVDGPEPKLTWTVGESTVTLIVQDTVVGEYDFDVRIDTVEKAVTNNVTTIRIHPQ